MIKRKQSLNLSKQTIEKINFKAVIFGFFAGLALRGAFEFCTQGNFLGFAFSVLGFLFFVILYLRACNKKEEEVENNDYEPNLIF